MSFLLRFKNFLLLGTYLIPAIAFATQEAPQTFTFDGRAFSNTTATTPLLDNISFRVQILNQAQDCILYEEQQSLSTATTDGYFTIQVGSVVGAPKRSALDSAHPMSVVFSNTSGSISGKLVSNGAACSYSPIAANVRYLRLLMTPSDNVTRTISPNMALDSVPLALVAERAETLQGFYPTDFLNINNSTAVLTQANAENIFSSTNYSRLTSLLSVPPANYVQTGANGSAALPVVNGNPSSGLTAGQIWYDSGSNVLKYYDGSVKTLGISGGTSGISSLTAATSTDSIDNTNYAQTWNWSTATTQNSMSLTANALTTGTILSVTSSDASLNSTNGLLYVANTGASTTGTVARIQSNSTAGSGLTVLANGSVGIGTTTPAGILDVRGGTAAAATNGSDINIIGQSGGTGATGGGSIFLFPGTKGSTGSTDGHVFLGGDPRGFGVGALVIVRGTSAGGWPFAVMPYGNSGYSQVWTSSNGSYEASVDYAGNANFPIMTSPNVYGSGSASSNLTIDSTSHATKGNIFLAPSGGSVGIGTTSATGTKLHVVDGTYSEPMAIFESACSACGVGPMVYNNATQAGSSAIINFGTGGAGTPQWSGSFGAYRVNNNVDSGFIFTAAQNGNPIERMRIDGSGNVGIGASAPTAKLEIQGQVRTTGAGGAAQINASAAVDWNNGNAQSMSVACTSTTFTNMLDGGTYILAVTETGTTTCTFSQAGLTFYFNPANGNRTSGQRSVYTFQRIGTDVYVSWISGFQ